GISTSPVPIWADTNNRFFALTVGLACGALRRSGLCIARGERKRRLTRFMRLGLDERPRIQVRQNPFIREGHAVYATYDMTEAELVPPVCPLEKRPLTLHKKTGRGEL